MRGSPQISQAVRAGWLRKVQRGQGKRASVEGGEVEGGEGDGEIRRRGGGIVRVPGGGGMPQFRQGGIEDVEV